MDTRLRILKEAGILFGRFGIKSITMDTIADHLGISKRTIYENFKDKDDLLTQSIEEGMNFHKKVFSDLVAKSSNVIEAIFKINRMNCEMQEKINPLFFKDLKKYHPHISKRITENPELAGENMTYNLIRKGINEGVFLKGINIEIFTMLIHEIVQTINFGALSESDFKLEELFDNSFGILLRGISSEKGLKIIEKEINKKKDKL